MKFFISMFFFLRSLFLPGASDHSLDSQKCQINVESAGIYIDKCKQFTFAYPKMYHLKLFTKRGYEASFVQDNGTEIDSLYIDNTHFSTPEEWLKNINQSISPEQRITLKGKNSHDGMVFLTLSVSNDVGLSPTNKTIYAKSKQVVFLKNNLLYTFVLSPSLDPSYEKDFDHMVSTFHFYN